MHQLPEEFLSNPIVIHLVGAGGNGSQMLSGLARLHRALIAKGHPHGLDVTVWDPDTVTEANVGRQLFSPADISANKAVCLVHRTNLFHGIRWQAKPTRFRLEGWTHFAPIIIGCVDSAAARIEIEKRLGSTSYWLDLGNTQRTAQVILGFRHARSNFYDANFLPNVLDLFPALTAKGHREDRAPSCSLAEALEKQDLFINQAAATWALHLLWQWFTTGVLHHHGYFVNLAVGSVQPLKIDSATWLRMNPKLKPAVDAYHAALEKRRQPKAALA